MIDEHKIFRWEKFVFYASIVSLIVLGILSWYRKHIVLPKQQEIIESKAYLTIKELETENKKLRSYIDSLQQVINEK